MDDGDEWTVLRKGLLNNHTRNPDGQLATISRMVKMIQHRSSIMIKHPLVQDLMRSNQKFDLYLLDYNINDIMLGLAGHFRVPTVILSLVPPIKLLRDMIGNPAAVASVPVINDPNAALKSTFRERFSQFMGYVMEFAMTNVLHYFVFEPFYAEHFPASENYPTLDEVLKNVSLIMTNSHFSEGFVRPSLPNLIEIGGIQNKEIPDPLPKVNCLQHIFQWL